tara:strand:+ start:1447 stop:1662 length:216 start_codon:yes stop_codon:yes gene_type:complete
MSDGFDSAQAAYDAQQPFDSDDIDSFEFEKLSEQIKEALEDLRCSDPEHVASIKKDLADLRAELEDVKAGV